MAYLVDQEELISRIQQPRIADYMREAMSCYAVGAYRGCIVLSCIAMFDDLADKLEELAKVDTDAKEIFKEVSKRQKQQDVYENYLLDQLKAKGIMPELTATILDSIKDKRNRSAHPSGHHPSAEEARYVFSEAIDLVLSKPKLTTTQGVDFLLQRLSSSNFFPSVNIDDTTDIVKDEIQELHPRSFPYLVSKLVDLMSGGATKGLRQNARSFLFGLSRINDSDLNEIIVNKFVKAKVENDDCSNDIIGCLSANPKLFDLMNEPTKLRFKKILDNSIEGVPSALAVTKLTHPSSLLRELMRALSPEEFNDNFANQVRLYLKKRPYDTSMYPAFELNSDLLSEFKKDLFSRAGSSTYTTSNSFAKSYRSIESDVIEYLDGKDSFLIIINVLNAAQSNAYAAKSLRGSRFDSIPLTKEKARDFVSENKAEAEGYLEEYLRQSLDIDDVIARYLSEDDSDE